VEMGRIAGQNDDAAGWIDLHLVAVEPIIQTDIEDAGHKGVPWAVVLCTQASPDKAIPPAHRRWGKLARAPESNWRR
jgi:hypothetical protein